MDPLGIAAWCLGVLFGIGSMTLAWRRARRQASHLAREALQRAQDEATTLRTRGAQHSKEQAARLGDELRRERARAQAELAEYEAELQQREALAAGREREVEAFVTEVHAAAARLQAAKAAVRQRRQELSAHAGQRLQALECAAAMGRDAVLHVHVTERAARCEMEAQIRLRQREAELIEAATGEARRVMALAVDRYHGVSHLERVQNVIQMPERAVLDLFADADAPAGRIFTAALGCEIAADIAAATLCIRGDDPLAREIGRRAVRYLAAHPTCDGDKLRSIAETVRQGVAREVAAAGRRAVKSLRLGPMHPKIVDLVGRLKFRLSYSQNQWKHAVEVAHLAGLLAAELRLDVMRARRGGLLHDIGKAMTHDHEGSHAVLGASVARECGEDEIVANAIGAHHNDEPPRTPLAHIVAAADAISGARPGARREAVTQYLSRMQDIHRIASRAAAVQRVDIMDAGRVVRVTVGGQSRGALEPGEQSGEPGLCDAELYPLAQDIARALEEEIAFAGQIRVTVIRESRAVAVAH